MASVDKYYEWPEAVDETASRKPTAASIGTVTAAAGIGTLIRGAPSGDFASLSDGLKQKFVMAALGGERGFRSTEGAGSFYRESVPHPVRNLGEDAIKRYLEGKDASHVQSYRNSPDLAADNTNIVWWNSNDNRALRIDNMTGWHQVQAHATNTFDASTIVFRACLETSATTALYAGLLESPVAAIENWFQYQRGRKTGEEAVIDAGIAITNRAVTGAVVGFAVTGAVALLGAGPIIVTIAPVLMPVGLALYGFSALKRIQKARASDLPPRLVRAGTYFCSPRCHIRFAYETGHSALMRWEANRVAA